jgi:uncharacterized protein
MELKEIKAKRKFNILSIDGGGIRGIYPAAYLNYIQERLGASVHIREYFDLIVGTSTGGIIALALAMDVPSSEIVNLYKIEGPKIFSISMRRSLFGFLFPMYTNKNLIKNIRAMFGEKKLGEANCRLCIPSINVTAGQAIVLKTRHHEDYVNDYKLPAWEVAAATSAAPIYFPAFVQGARRYLDGGMWVNNPSVVGISEAVKLGYELDELNILSIGSGENMVHKGAFTSKYLGYSGWGSKLVDLTFEAQSQGATNIAKHLCKSYKRINSTLPPASFLGWSRFNLDSARGIGDLEEMATYKAKVTFSEVKAQFFTTKAQKFIPKPEN